MIADMSGLGAGGAGGGGTCVHGENLPCEFRSFHYPGGNRFRRGGRSPFVTTGRSLDFHPTGKENCHDPTILVASPRLACRRHLQRRVGGAADSRRKRAGVL